MVLRLFYPIVNLFSQMETILRFLVKGHNRNISVKSFLNHTTDPGGDVVLQVFSILLALAAILV